MAYRFAGIISYEQDSDVSTRNVDLDFNDKATVNLRDSVIYSRQRCRKIERGGITPNRLRSDNIEQTNRIFFDDRIAVNFRA